MKITPEDRQAAKEKKPSKPMTAVALAKLHTQKAEQRMEDFGLGRFAHALASVAPTPENLQKLISRAHCAGPINQLERRAQKLRWWVSAGYALGIEIDKPATISLFSTLTPEEERMSDAAFAALWSESRAKKCLAWRVAHGFVVALLPTKKIRKPNRSFLERLNAREQERRKAPVSSIEQSGAAF